MILDEVSRAFQVRSIVDLFLCKKNSSFRFVITQECIGAKVVCGAGMNNRLRPYDRYEMYEKYTFIYI